MDKHGKTPREPKPYHHTDNTSGLMFGLTAEEMARVGQEAAMKGRLETLAAGHPVSDEKDGKVILEYPDGRIEVIATY